MILGSKTNVPSPPGGDAFCQSLATAANFRGQFRMWLGDATGSPATRFIQSVVPYYRADGVLLAASYADVVDGPCWFR